MSIKENDTLLVVLKLKTLQCVKMELLGYCGKDEK